VSRENVETVRRFITPYDGRDVMPTLRAGIERLGPDPQQDAVLALWAEDPSWQHVHPEIEWSADMGLMAHTASGPREVLMWWKEWVEVWQSYIITTVELRDLEDWVLNVSDIHARGRQGIDVEMRVFELARIRDGRIAIYRTGFRSERAALKAVGLEE
jgi:hypothetical protein